jgi:hypothetical protein
MSIISLFTESTDFVFKIQNETFLINLYSNFFKKKLNCGYLGIWYEILELI